MITVGHKSGKKEGQLTDFVTLHYEMLNIGAMGKIQANLVMAMIVCLACKHMVYSPVDLEESDSLADGGTISRHCHHCGSTTDWAQIDWHKPAPHSRLLYQTTQPERL